MLINKCTIDERIAKLYGDKLCGQEECFNDRDILHVILIIK